MAKPPVPPPTGLDEVERALSVLEGRHPEHERTKRETMAAAEARGQALQKDLAKSARRRRRRAMLAMVGVLLVAGASVVAWRVAVRARAIRSMLAQAELPFVSQGLGEIASNEILGRDTLEADVPGSSCFVAIATGGDVRIREGALSAEGHGSVGWCSCSAGRITVEGAPQGGVALLRTDARRLGGPLARSWSNLQPAIWAEGDRECADTSLDDWIADHKWPAPALEEEWLQATPARTSLRRSGFRVVSGVEAGRPFGVVESAAGECFLAVGGPRDELALRAKGGTRRIAHARGVMAWCSSVGETATVWREGPSSVVVMSVASTRVGGQLGVRECAEEAGLPLTEGATWLGEGDLGWDAASLLQASALTEVTNAPAPPEPGPKDARLTALDVSAATRLVSEPTSAVVACDPPLQSPPTTRASVCAVAEPVSWWRKTDAPAGVARASLPFWLSLFDTHHEPDAIARIPELLTLARRLVRQGFVPTVLEGVTELADGVRIIGRAGEDKVVAIGLGPRAPWAFPYTNGVPWDLGDMPRVVDLQPGLAVTLRSTPPSGAPLEKRRTVVFRHGARP